MSLNTESVITASNLNLTFQTNDGPVHVLSDVKLEIGQGEFVSFIGPSGVREDGSARVMADLEQPTGGSITVNGMTPEQARLSRAYCYLFQAAGLYPWLTIEKNVRLPVVPSSGLFLLQHGCDVAVPGADH